ncbi:MULTISPECIES: DUF6299 family protein [unclassified Streptomyces]|uniref:DUF6299 family protein n=1 Tax=unclassified Streptomyces TaxID=2593676 RepID=UPI0022519614|nr:MULTISPECIES: DUF6299 family protein [unclassified Streptomyces]MCX4526306.1 DUF6299 family protein [Streptomyces sp. NBC_01551]MCX4543130.1 DUF6299 family protein [Streptomyces sp. NBC_01565]
MALAALSALAAAAVFTVPANATVFENHISVWQDAHIGDDHTVTLSGTYVCNDPSPARVQLSTAVVQNGIRLGKSAGNVVCDGEEHEWQTTASMRFTKGLSAGEALGEARLEVIHMGGLLPKAIDTLAEDSHEIRLIDHR